MKSEECYWCKGTGKRQKNIAKEPSRGIFEPHFNVPISPLKPIYKTVDCEVCEGTGKNIR